MRFVDSHPSRKNKNAARVGHPVNLPSYAGFQCTAMRTEAEWFSHSRVSLPVVPPRSERVYFRFSTSASGLLMVIFTRPKSCVLSYLVPHWPVCLLMMRTQWSGLEISTYRE